MILFLDSSVYLYLFGEIRVGVGTVALKSLSAMMGVGCAMLAGLFSFRPGMAGHRS